MSGSMLVDLDPRNAPSNPADFVETGGSVYFSARVPTTNWYGIYKSDGTAAGTRLAYRGLTDNFYPQFLNGWNGILLYKGSNGLERYDPATNTAATIQGMTFSNPMVPLPNGSGMVFAGTPFSGSPELWRTDGTSAGTTMVSDIFPGSIGSSPDSLTSAGNWIYFTARDPAGGRELWKTDGTTANTTRVKDIAAGTANSNPAQLTAVGSTVYFVANDGVSGFELWSTDGTDANTRMVVDLTTGSGSSSISNLAAVGNGVCFTTADGKVWTSDGTAAGTQSIGTYSSPSNLTGLGTLLTFTTTDGKLWRSDGTAGGTSVIHASQYNSSLKVAHGKLYFNSTDATTGTELWVTNGTIAGTSIVQDLASGAASSNPTIMLDASSGVFFTADDVTHGLEPFAITGTSQTPVLLGDLITTPFSSNPYNLFNFRDNLFFLATTPSSTQASLFRSDGTPEGTLLIATGVDSAIPSGNSIYFVRGNTLFRTDGTATGVEPVKTFATAPALMQAVAGKMTFTLQPVQPGGYQIWVSDGSAAGTVMLRDFTSPPSPLHSVTAMGSKLFFYADDGTHGYEPWVTDGTVAGTLLLRDIQPGTGASSFFTTFQGGDPLFFNGQTYFVAYNGTDGVGLWKTDGTPTGTVLVKSSPPGSNGSLFTGRPLGAFLIVANGLIFWISDDTGYLWRSDGTTAGTFVTRPRGFATNLSAGGNRVFFTDRDPDNVNFYDLYTNDGSAAGTTIVRRFQNNFSDQNPGIRWMGVVNGVAYFYATDPNDGLGESPWRSDGTAAGTVRITADQIRNDAQAVVVNGDRFYADSDPVHGRELWEIPGPLPALPAAPANLTATPFAADRIDLTWNDVASNESSYRLERSTSSSFAFIDASFVLLPGTTSFSDSGLLSAQTYYYRLAARNDAGGSSAVTASTSTSSALPAPTNFVAVASGGALAGKQVDLTWSDNAQGEDEYLLERSLSSSFQTVDLSVHLSANTTSYSDTTVARRTTYYYRLRAVSAAGRSQQALASVATPDTLPAAPQNLIAFGYSTTMIELQWTDASDNESSFVIERAAPGQSFQQVATVAAGQIIYDEQPPRTDVPFQYRVRGTGTAGPGDYSNVATAAVLPPQLSTLVKDLNATPYPTGSSNPGQPVVMGGFAYFAATEVTTGQELWRSDGTAAGTTRVVDLVPGAGSSFPQQLTAVGSLLYFTADDGTHGRELWRTDGTALGTVLLADISTGGGDAHIGSIVNVNGTAFFNAADIDHGAELWASDGTPTGTRLVKDIAMGPGGSFVDSLVAAGGVVYFNASDPANGSELWRSDGTNAGTVIATDIAPGTASSNGIPLGALGSKLLFTATTSATGRELWVTDGSAAGTQALGDLNPGSASSSISSFTPSLSVAYFFANDGVHGNELWRTDGTLAGTQLLKDTVPGSGSAKVTGQPVMSGGKLYFGLLDAVNGPVTLWRSDGTTAGTAAIKQVVGSNMSTAAIFEAVDVNGRLAFSTSQYSARQIWLSDGTDAGTQLVAGRAGDASNAPQGLAVLGSQILYNGTDPAAGRELFSVDVIAGTSTLLKDINSYTDSSNPDWVTAYNGSIYFTTDVGSGVPAGLWRTDGTDTGTTMIRAGAVSGLAVANGLLFFRSTDSATGSELWQSDGTAAHTSMVADITPGAASTSIRTLIGSSSQLFFTVRRADGSYALWRSDGTAAGTRAAGNVSVSYTENPFKKGDMIVANGVLYFRGDDSGGIAVWRSDGTTTGTHILQDPSTVVTAGDPFGFVAVGPSVYFVGYGGGANGAGLFKTDGTAAGTVLASDIYDGVNVPPIGSLAAAGNRLVFAADDPIKGYELWSTDGTPAGTSIIADLIPGSAASFPSNLTTVGNRVYFVSYDGIGNTRRGLYVTDGTSAGTTRLRSVSGPDSAQVPYDIMDVNGTAFIIDASYLWRSDGTPAGTVQVMQAKDFSNYDPAPVGPRSAVLGNELYLRAYDPVHGRELWSVSATPPTAPSNLTVASGKAVVATTSKNTSALTAGSSATTQGVQLNWTDRSKDESGFLVERSTTSNFSVLEASFFLGANVTSFTDAAAPATGQRYYRVRAVNAAGTSAYSNTVTPGVGAATVLGRHLFYNNSKFDGANPLANTADDAAIATDKIALLPDAGKATAANISSYDKGINGVMVDVVGLPTGAGPVSGDFDVALSTDGITWTTGVAPSVSIRRAVGASVDRVTLVWPDGLIKNKWMRLTMKATAATGLTTPDIFYWGSAVGDSGNGLAADTTVNVDSNDYYGVRDHLRSYDNPAPVTWNWDINRDGVTDISDMLLVRSSATTTATALKLITAPQQASSGLQAPGGGTSVKPVSVVPLTNVTPSVPSSPPASAPATTTVGTSSATQAQQTSSAADSPQAPVVTKSPPLKRFRIKGLVSWGRQSR